MHQTKVSLDTAYRVLCQKFVNTLDLVDKNMDLNLQSTVSCPAPITGQWSSTVNLERLVQPTVDGIPEREEIVHPQLRSDMNLNYDMGNKLVYELFNAGL